MFSYVSPEQRIPKNHPLRAIRALVDEVLADMSREFDRLYATTGRPSIPPERLLRAQLLQVFYSIRSELLLMEQLDYNLLFRWFVGLTMDDRVWDATTFTKNRDRLLNHEVARSFFRRVVERAHGLRRLGGSRRPGAGSVCVWGTGGRQRAHRKLSGLSDWRLGAGSDGRAFTQALKFGAEFSLSTEVTRLDCASERSGSDPVHILELADGRRVRAHAFVVATGARYRRPDIPDLKQYEGRGVSYWASPVEARLCRNQDVALVGGGNSAGQAAVFLASHARHLRVLMRGPDFSSTMSRYLIERIAASPNITVLGETEVVELLGTPDQGLQGVRWRNRRTGAEERHAIAHLFVFTGADPVANWLTGSGIPIDEKGFIRTGANVGSTQRSPLPLETGVEGIFAIGDVRCGSAKRVGAAIGEGAAVVAHLHTFLDRRDPTATRTTRAEAR